MTEIPTSPQDQPPPPHRSAIPQPPRGQAQPIVTNDYDHEKATWGLGDMLLSLGVYFVGSVTLFLTIFGLTGNDGFPQGPWLLVGVAGPHAMLLVHLLWVSRRKGQGLSPDFQLRVQWSDIGLGAILLVVALFGAGLIAVVITQLVGEAPTSSAIEAAQESTDGSGLTIWLYLFAILGATFIPVVEELVYRGLFWSALEKRGMRPWAILALTSTVFAVIHLEPVRTPVLFAVGMAIGYGRLRTGRIGASIITHMLINAFAMIATLVELA